MSQRSIHDFGVHGRVLEISFVAVSAYSSENVIVSDIILEEEATELNEVVVREDKQRFDQKIDRLVINLEGSITVVRKYDSGSPSKISGRDSEPPKQQYLNEWKIRSQGDDQ